MQDEEHLTADECEELSQFLRQDAASKPTGPEREKLQELAENYCKLARLKRTVLKKVN